MAEPILVGDRFGRLTIESRGDSHNHQRRWSVVCDCGVRKSVAAAPLRDGRTRSCGCLNREARIARNTVHGGARRASRHPLYALWMGMVERCRNPKHVSFKYYGARGVRVCARWTESFEAFLEDMAPRPTPAHSLDRFPDNDGNYEPGNVRWATAAEQAANRRSVGAA